MKRLNKYSIFWVLYFLSLFYGEYQWDREILSIKSDNELLARVFLSTLIYLTPQIFCATLINRIALKSVPFSGKPDVNSLLQIFSVFLVTLLVLRLFSYFLIRPVILKVDAGPIKNLWNFNLVFAGFVYLSFPVGVMLIIQSIKQQIIFHKRQNDLTKEKLRAELNLLRNQLNPHFLFNTLNNIYALCRKKSDLAPEAVIRLSELLSFMLYKADKGDITMQQEIGFLEDYISLEKIRYTDRLKIISDYNIDNYEQLISPLLFLPLLENAFKHGAGETSDEGFIKIHIKLKKGILDFIITNSFALSNTPENSDGIGIKNIKKQIELRYQRQMFLISKDNNVFCVNIKIDLNSNGKD